MRARASIRGVARTFLCGCATIACHDRVVTSLRERLLAVMDRKHHWAYPALTRPGLARAQLFEHFRHEYLVYVRDFPALLARALGTTPPIDDVRRSLAENLYEEQTGGLSGTAPHPQLFLRMMAGLGFEASAFDDDDAWLHDAARRYRDFLRERSCAAPWQAAVALLTIFVEGSVNERAELEGTYVRRARRGGGARARAREALRLPARSDGADARARAGRRGPSLRRVADRARRTSARRRAIEAQVVATCEEALAAWHAYRDGVAERMHLRRA